jgi:hypothetical protein
MPVSVCSRFGHCWVHCFSRHAAELPIVRQKWLDLIRSEGQRKKNGSAAGSPVGAQRAVGGHGQPRFRSAWGCPRPAPLGRPGRPDQSMKQASSEGKRDRSKGCSVEGGRGRGRRSGEVGAAV